MGEPPLFGVWNLLCVTLSAFKMFVLFHARGRGDILSLIFDPKCSLWKTNFCWENKEKKEDATLWNKNKVKTDRFFENLN